MNIRLAAAAALTVALAGITTPAHATRIADNYDEPDYCANMAGHQGAAAFTNGYVRYKMRTPQPDDCRKGWRYQRRYGY